MLQYQKTVWIVNILILTFLLLLWLFYPHKILSEVEPLYIPEVATTTEKEIPEIVIPPVKPKTAVLRGVNLSEQQSSNKALIVSLAEEKGVNSTLAVAIAICESGLIETAKNKGSSATGLFQILKGTFKDYNCLGDRLNAEDNAVCGIKILKISGTTPWNESKSCWIKKI